MKWPLVSRKRFESSEHVRVNLEGSNNELRKLAKEQQMQISDLLVKVRGLEQDMQNWTPSRNG